MIADDFFAYEFRTPDNLNTPQYLMRVTSAETFEEFIGLILTPEAAAELFDNFEPFFRSRNDLLLFIANIAVNYATYDTRERQGYGYNSSFDLDRTLADKFFHLRDKLYPESNYLLSCDAEANFGFASPWNVGVSTGFGYAVKNFIFSLHNDEGAFSVVNTDVDPETQRRIHEALTWFKNTFGITAVADCLATVILNGKPAGPFVHDPLDGREPFELPCATRWFKNPNASFEVTPGDEKTETARPNTDSIHQAPLHP